LRHFIGLSYAETMKTDLKTEQKAHPGYHHGFGNHFESEAIAGTLPQGQNSPQKVAMGLYAEQLSGSPFTSVRHRNLRTWLYKIHPSVKHSPFVEIGHPTWLSDDTHGKWIKTPQALRFHPYPLPAPTQKIDFIQSLFTYARNGNPSLNTGSAVHLYAFNEGMRHRYAYNADAEMMIVPEHGEILVHTELGILELSPLYIGVIPRGMKFKVELKSGTTTARGYTCENFGSPFQLPELGPIGANGLANGRDFEIPKAHFEDVSGKFELIARYQGSNWQAELEHSPLDVVAWHGNYAPYRYDLRKFNTFNTVSYDHPDPSIFTVLTAPTAIPGTANLDFVIFPPRWMVAENTFRPPYYHRNLMNEFMGLIEGQYDAKAEGFKPGGASIHNAFTGHGPDFDAYQKASTAELKPIKLDGTMAFMWETQYPYYPSEQAMKKTEILDHAYTDCWKTLRKQFQEK
jgi:homogentisate 1,2-dioxygenase